MMLTNLERFVGIRRPSKTARYDLEEKLFMMFKNKKEQIKTNKADLIFRLETLAARVYPLLADRQTKLILVLDLEKQEFLDVKTFLSALADTGLTNDDPRLAVMFKKLREIQKEKMIKYKAEDGYGINLEIFTT